jgi:sugar phosphate isomerase/epimerase
MFALSLSWNSHKQISAKSQIEQIITAGFQTVELNFNLTQNKLEQISKLRTKGLIKVVSCHNFCPIPPELAINSALPDYYSLSALNENNRRLALKYTKRTIDTVAKLKARVAVLHFGKVEIPDYSKQLMHLFSQAKLDTVEFKQLAAKMQQLRQEKKSCHLENAIKSIKELSSYAVQRGVFIGLENRIYHREIPQIDEFELMLNYPNVFFWFDTGHAYINEKLWSIKTTDYLKRYSSKLIGLHLHDVQGMTDHLAPGCGEFKFENLKPYIKRDIIKVIEAHAPVSAEQLKQSVKFLNKALN